MEMKVQSLRPVHDVTRCDYIYCWRCYICQVVALYCLWLRIFLFQFYLYWMAASWLVEKAKIVFSYAAWSLQENYNDLRVYGECLIQESVDKTPAVTAAIASPVESGVFEGDNECGRCGKDMYIIPAECCCVKARVNGPVTAGRKVSDSSVAQNVRPPTISVTDADEEPSEKIRFRDSAEKPEEPAAVAEEPDDPNSATVAA